eukprot:15068-Heterococcus_DN1.PRE.1
MAPVKFLLAFALTVLGSSTVSTLHSFTFADAVPQPVRFILCGVVRTGEASALFASLKSKAQLLTGASAIEVKSSGCGVKLSIDRNATFATGDDDYTRSLCAKINCVLGSVCKIYEGHDRSLKGGSDDGDKGHSGSDDHHNKEEEHEKPEYEKPEYEKPEHEKKVSVTATATAIKLAKQFLHSWWLSCIDAALSVNEAEPKKPKYYKYAVCEKVAIYTPPAPHAPAPKTPDAPPACPKDYTCGSKAGTYCVMEKESDDDSKSYWHPKCKCASGCSGGESHFHN